MPGEINESQIRKTAIYLGLPADFIRKDYFVTKAIRLLTNVQDDYFELIFQGGTSLSKGHCLINRLKEHAMFELEASDANDLLSNSKLALQDLRSNQKWEEHWNFFIEQMVYHPDKPTFEQAMAVVEGLMPVSKY